MADTLILHVDGPEEWIVRHPDGGGKPTAGRKHWRGTIWNWLAERDMARSHTCEAGFGGRWIGFNREIPYEEAGEAYDSETTLHDLTDDQSAEI